MIKSWLLSHTAFVRARLNKLTVVFEGEMRAEAHIIWPARLKTLKKTQIDQLFEQESCLNKIHEVTRTGVSNSRPGGHIRPTDPLAPARDLTLIVQSNLALQVPLPPYKNTFVCNLI